MPRGPAPKPADLRRRRNAPAAGDWQSLDVVGWQHGPVPEPPEGLMKASADAWAAWFGSWVAAHWSADDLPALRQLIRLYDQVERGEFQRANEVRLEMDGFGLTPKGRQSLRWLPPAQEPKTAQVRQIKPRRLSSA